MSITRPVLIISTLFASVSSAASDIDQALDIQDKSLSASAKSQKRIDSSDERIQRLKAEVEQLKADVDNLSVYQKHLTRLLESQQQEQESLDSQLNQIQVTRQGLVPLMYHMLDGLKRLADSTVPVKKTQRNERITRLEKLMTRSDVSDAEKYRLILDAYQTEIEYGNKLGVYSERITINGELREVEILHLGRLSLIARSLNGERYWQWDSITQQWQTGETGIKDELEKAYQIAHQRLAPDFITLPIRRIDEEATQ